MAVLIGEALDALKEAAPLELAEPWDNVGLLLEPLPAGEAPPLACIFLTVDLTEPVLEEALEWSAGLIVAYHPPIFAGLKRLTQADPKVRLILRAAQASIAIYSPHTALDAVPAGLNDWLAEAVGRGEVEPLVPKPDYWAPGAGMGRRIVLERPTPLNELVRRIKSHLGLSQVRVAAASRHRSGEVIRNVAVCAGAGGSVFDAAPSADLYLTGELRHHDVLAKTAAGSSVVLCDHSNTERGYLPVFAARLADTLGEKNVQIVVSSRDRDPLAIT